MAYVVFLIHKVTCDIQVLHCVPSVCSKSITTIYTSISHILAERARQGIARGETAVYKYKQDKQFDKGVYVVEVILYYISYAFCHRRGAASMSRGGWGRCPAFCTRWFLRLGNGSMFVYRKLRHAIRSSKAVHAGPSMAPTLAAEFDAPLPLCIDFPSSSAT